MHATTRTATPSHTDAANPRTSHTHSTHHPGQLAASLALDSVACIYSHATHTVTQIALRPACDEVDRDALDALYELVKERVASVVAAVLELDEARVLPNSTRAFRVEQATSAEEERSSRTRGFSLSFERQAGGVSASKWEWERDGEGAVRWSADKWRVEFGRV